MSGSIHVPGILRQILVIIASAAVTVVLMNTRLPFISRFVWAGSIIAVIGVAIAVLSVRSTSPLRGLGRQAASLLGGTCGARSPSQSNDIDAIRRVFTLTEQLKLDCEKYCEELQEAKRLSTLGQLAAGVAHELNNPLGGILVYANLILEDMAADDVNRENLSKIIRETNRCRNIVRGLLDFARQGPPNLTVTDINAVISEALKNVRQEVVSRDVRITERFGEELPQVLADGSQIQEVFENLILNAMEALEEKRSIFITSDVSENSGEGRYVRVIFADTGQGIAPEHLERIFEPFFTTKRTGHGTGLGLAVSYGIVERHGGTITVRNRHEGGAEFTVKLPLERKRT